MAELSLEFETDSLFFEIGAELSYSKPNNSLPFYNNKPFTTQNYFAEFSLELPWNMEFEIAGDYTINNQWADGYNISFLLLDCYIGKRFLENENLILAIEGNVNTDYVKENGMGNIDIARMEKALGQLAETYEFSSDPEISSFFTDKYLP